ncbi:hypothetical protein M413DRAFT_36924, partial [Hebeloma cylindrosporum]
DALNSCLCGLVLDGSEDSVLRCKQAGCETQWFHLKCMKLQQAPRNWVCAVRLPGEDAGESAHADDIVLLYWDAFLIT